jgi:hypothetical protein
LFDHQTLLGVARNWDVGRGKKKRKVHYYLCFSFFSSSFFHYY